MLDIGCDLSMALGVGKNTNLPRNGKDSCYSLLPMMIASC